MIDLNVKFVMEYGKPFEEIIRDDRYGGHVHRGSMMYSKFKVDFKYWKSNGSIDIVLTRNGVTQKYNNKTQELKWKYYRFERKLKITKDNVYFFNNKSIRNATQTQIHNMVFTGFGCAVDPTDLYQLLYGDRQAYQYGYSVKKTRDKQIYNKRKAFVEIHKIFESPEITDEMLNDASVHQVKLLFKCLKYRDYVSTIKTYLELVKDSSMDTIQYHNFVYKSYDPITRTSEYILGHDIQPPIVHKFQHSTTIDFLSNAFIPDGYCLTFKGKYKLGLHTVITKENCEDYGLHWYRMEVVDNSIPF
jgi:hypothetical protein